VYAYFTYAATANKITDDVTKLVMHSVFNTNSQYSGTSFTHIFDKNVDYLTSLNKILFVKTCTIFWNLCDFWNTMVSQGSAATSVRYSGIYNAHFVANFVLSLTVKGFW